jgi:hypothetical protein
MDVPMSIFSMKQRTFYVDPIAAYSHVGGLGSSCASLIRLGSYLEAFGLGAFPAKPPPWPKLSKLSSTQPSDRMQMQDVGVWFEPVTDKCSKLD